MTMCERFGGKRALLRTAWTPLFVLSTARRRFAGPVSRPIERFVFICAGNICRSPFAERVARRRGASAISMGLKADSGVPADATAAAVALCRGIDLSTHRAQCMDVGRLLPSDLLLGFELWHVEALERLVEGLDIEVRLAGAFADPWHQHVPDPYGLSDACFQRCFDTIERAVAAMLRDVAHGTSK